MKHLGIMAVGFALGSTLTYFVARTDVPDGVHGLGAKLHPVKALVVTEATPVEVRNAERSLEIVSGIAKVGPELPPGSADGIADSSDEPESPLKKSAD